MTPVQQLRLGVALAHAVPGAQLRLVDHDGRLLCAGAHPAADLDLCALRRVVSRRLGAGGVPEGISGVGVGGSLEHLGGGLYRRRAHDVEERWFVSFLEPGILTTVLEGCDPGRLGHGSAAEIHGCLLPDAALGVTVVSLTMVGSGSALLLDPFAAATLASCLVEELLQDSQESTSA